MGGSEADEMVSMEALSPNKESGGMLYLDELEEPGNIDFLYDMPSSLILKGQHGEESLEGSSIALSIPGLCSVPDPVLCW